MNWLAHFFIGLLLGLAVFYLLGAGPLQLAALALFAGCCALLPDLDAANSKARQAFDWLAIASAFALSYYSACLPPAPAPDFSCVAAAPEQFLLRALAIAGAYFVFFTAFKPPHRGITHSLAFLGLFAALIYLVLGRDFAIAGAIGYCSHLAADQRFKMF